MSDLQNQLSTGRRLNKPSDDPIGTTYALRYRSEISINDQYQRNLEVASSSISHLDTVLGQLNDVCQRAKELTVQGVNGTNPQSALNAISLEIGDLYNQAVSLGNDQINGKYTFNGQITDKQPYTQANAQNEQTDDGQIVYQFAAGITIDVNKTGNEVIGNPAPPAPGGDDTNLFAVLKGLRDAFASGNQAGAAALMDKLDSRMNKITDIRSEVGARTNRIEMLGNQLTDWGVNLQGLSSKVEDADMAATIMNFQTQENVYQASLSTGAKIIQPSLIDYLK
jgi:flagellar hook-associated protein 3 FlgL